MCLIGKLHILLIPQSDVLLQLVVYDISDVIFIFIHFH